MRVKSKDLVLSFVGIRKGLFADVCVYCVKYVHV